MDIGKITKGPDGRYSNIGEWRGGASTLYEYTFDLESGATTERVLTPLPAGLTGMDFPRIHPALTGKPIKFCYCATLTGPVTTGVAKVDVASGNIVGRIEFPAGCFGSGDPVFVPAKGAQSSWAAWQKGAKAVEGAEDEGFLLTFVNNELANNASEARFEASNLLRASTCIRPLSQFPRIRCLRFRRPPLPPPIISFPR